MAVSEENNKENFKNSPNIGEHNAFKIGTALRKNKRTKMRWNRKAKNMFLAIWFQVCQMVCILSNRISQLGYIL
jgi:hypothetical protein